MRCRPRLRFQSRISPSQRQLVTKMATCWNGAAQESNLPSLGLPDLTGFEDRLGHRAHAAPPRSVAPGAFVYFSWPAPGRCFRREPAVRRAGGASPTSPKCSCPNPRRRAGRSVGGRAAHLVGGRTGTVVDVTSARIEISADAGGRVLAVVRPAARLVELATQLLCGIGLNRRWSQRAAAQKVRNQSRESRQHQQPPPHATDATVSNRTSRHALRCPARDQRRGAGPSETRRRRDRRVD